MRFWYLLVAPGLVFAGISAAPIAAASCTTVDYMTVCPLGDGDGDWPTRMGSGNSGWDYGPGYYRDRYRWFTP